MQIIAIPGVDVDLILENIDYNHTEEVSRDVHGGEYLFDGITVEQNKELEDTLNDVLCEWMEKHDIKSNYFTITDEEIINL